MALIVAVKLFVLRLFESVKIYTKSCAYVVTTDTVMSRHPSSNVGLNVDFRLF